MTTKNSRSAIESPLSLEQVFHGDSSALYTILQSLRRRWPQVYGKGLLRSLWGFLLDCHSDFAEIHSPQFIAHLVAASYLLRKRVLRYNRVFPEKRWLYLRTWRSLLHFPFGEKELLGIGVALHMDRETEWFGKRQIKQAVEALLPDAVCFDDSYVVCEERGENVAFHYLEFEHADGRPFSRKEHKLLRGALREELTCRIAKQVSPILGLRNEEEVYRNLIQLSSELRFVRDLPQVMISFVGQSETKLKFQVACVRLVEEDALNLREKALALSGEWEVAIDRVIDMGRLRKKYLKEGSSFTIQIARAGSIRHDSAIDLIRARVRVAEGIRKLVGEFRDYNGGLLQKQSSHFEQLKQELVEVSPLVVEKFFESLLPPLHKATMPISFLASHLRVFANWMEDPDFLTPLCDARVLKSPEGSSLFFQMPKGKVEIEEILGQFPESASVSVEKEGVFFIGLLFLHLSMEEGDILERQAEALVEEYASKWNQAQVLRLNLPRPASSLDPRIDNDRVSAVLLKMFYEGLMRMGPQNRPECGVAKSVDISPDHLTYRFTLRNCSWTNGMRVSAADFVYAWKKILDPQFSCPYDFLFHVIKNGELAKKGEVDLSEVGIEALDCETLVVELERPYPYFLSLTAHWIYSPLCAEIDRLSPGWSYYALDSYVGNGPFKLGKWSREKQMEIIPNPDYWDRKSVKLEKIVVSHLDDHHLAHKLFKEGLLDWVGEPLFFLPYKDHESLIRSGELESQAMAALFWLELKVNTFPFQSKAIRKAIAYSIDRKRLIKDVLGGRETPATRLIHPQYAPYLEQGFPDGNAKAARALFEEGLEELGLTREQFPQLSLRSCRNPLQFEVVKELARQISSVLEIDVKARYSPLKHLLGEVDVDPHEIVGLVYFAWYNDPIYHLEFLKESGDRYNTTGWSNEEFLETLEKADQEIDLGRRFEALAKAEKIALDEMPLIPIFHYHYRFRRNPRLKDVVLTDVGHLDFKYATIS